MQIKKAASVFPEPVGAEMSTLRPAAISGQPCSWGSVACWNRESNHSETRGSKPARGMASSIVTCIMTWGNERRNISLEFGVGREFLQIIYKSRQYFSWREYC